MKPSGADQAARIAQRRSHARDSKRWALEPPDHTVDKTPRSQCACMIVFVWPDFGGHLWEFRTGPKKKRKWGIDHACLSHGEPRLDAIRMSRTQREALSQTAAPTPTPASPSGGSPAPKRVSS
ncbi:hypothetical protein L1887_54187 [Cichorium endivia]|nr:hypothetical protein L1887_54187 [Cichorium endivia]